MSQKFHVTRSYITVKAYCPKKLFSLHPEYHVQLLFNKDIFVFPRNNAETDTHVLNHLFQDFLVLCSEKNIVYLGRVSALV